MGEVGIRSFLANSNKTKRVEFAESFLCVKRRALRVPYMEYVYNTHYGLFYQGRIKRRGHATAIYQIANRRGRASKNRQEIIARALLMRHLAS